MSSPKNDRPQVVKMNMEIGAARRKRKGRLAIRRNSYIRNVRIDRDLRENNEWRSATEEEESYGHAEVVSNLH